MADAPPAYGVPEVNMDVTDPVYVMPGAIRAARRFAWRNQNACRVATRFARTAAARSHARAARLGLTMSRAGAADLNAAVYDRALKSLVEVLENAFGAGATRVDLSLRTLTNGAVALVFVDNGHGATTGLSGVFNAGYSTDEGRAAKEQNRMFHRGLVLCLDSLGVDCHLFSQTRDAATGVSELQVARYGPVLTALLEDAPAGGNRQPLRTVCTQMTQEGTLLQRGRPATDAAAVLLRAETAFDGVQSLRIFIKAILGEREGSGPDAPGFGGLIILREGLGVERNGDDLVQGEFSLRRFIKERYVPHGFGVSGVHAPCCKVYINGCEAPLAKWNTQNRSPLYTRTVRLGGAESYKLDLRMCMAPAEGKGSHYKLPSIRAVLQGTCIATDVPSKSFENTNSKFFDLVETSHWTRRNDASRVLDGHERDGFSHLVGLLSNTEAATKNSSTSCKAPIARDGSQLQKEASILEKKHYIEFNRQMRAVLGGDGIDCLVSVKPSGGSAAVDASNMFTAHKGALKNEELIREVRLLAHQAIVHWGREAFKLRHPAMESPLWPKLLEEQAAGASAAAEAAAAAKLAKEAKAKKAKQAAAKARAEEKAAKEAAARAAAAAAAAAEASSSSEEEEEEEEEEDAAHSPGAGAGAQPKPEQNTATVTPALGKGTRRKRGDDEEDEDDEGFGGGAAGFDDGGAGPLVDSATALQRLDGRHPPRKCAMCSHALDASVAARVAAAAAEQRRLVHDLSMELAAANARIAELEGIVLRIQG